MENTNKKIICKECGAVCYRRYFLIGSETYCYECLMEKHCHYIKTNSKPATSTETAENK